MDPQTKQATRKKFFDGLTFHRVIPDFMIQGGDPLGNGTGRPEGPGFPYKSEVVPSLKFDTPGRLAMANAGPNTNGSQFFITEAPQPALNGGYTIWGQCGNVDVVKAIARVKRDGSDRPVTPVLIQHAIVERVGPAPADAPEAMPPANPPTRYDSNGRVGRPSIASEVRVPCHCPLRRSARLGMLGARLNGVQRWRAGWSECYAQRIPSMPQGV